MREIEIKCRVTDFVELEKNLEKEGCILSEPIFQHDVIYSKKTKGAEFESIKEGEAIIRIRHLKNTAELNLKQQQSSEMDNLEYETEVSDPKATHEILTHSGWKPVIEVKKVRRKGKLGRYEVCLDVVEKLGTFVELELLAEDDVDPREVRRQLFEKLAALGISEDSEETRGYDTQMCQLKK